MAIQIKLFGDLGRIYRGNTDSSGFPVSLKIKSSKVKTIFEVIKLLGIPKSEISHIFVNGTFSGLGKVVNDGDRIGLFPIRMSLIFLEVTKEKTINLSIDVYQEQEKNEISKISLDMPEGSTLELIMKKLRIPTIRDKLLIQVNGQKIHDENHILKNNDKLIIEVLLEDRI